MESIQANPFGRDKLTVSILEEWQNLLNLAAELFAVPAGLITRVEEKQIEIFMKSENRDNPYPAGCTAPYPDSGWYCEHTLKSRDLNLIPNALRDPKWENNDAVKMQMISYMGIPIERPDGGEFGTVCFLDNKENAHNDVHIRLLRQIGRMIELSLRVIYDKERIDHRDRLLDDLSRIYPLCSYCKKVRDENTGEWIAVEKYVRDISGKVASHGICPQCYAQEMKLLS
jgi:c-di-GMP phosphodiesterase